MMEDTRTVEGSQSRNWWLVAVVIREEQERTAPVQPRLRQRPGAKFTVIQPMFISMRSLKRGTAKP
jgi:hypothetical protein